MTANSTASAPHIYATMLARVVASVSALSAAGSLPPSLDTSRVVVEPPRDASHGDMATNAAMVLAKDAGKKPREVAEAIAERLRADDLVEKVDVAGPGFINITLKASAWTAALAAAIAAGTQYGRSQVGQGTKVNVEYVSANPTGPMHVGHCRGAVFGDALASLLAFVGFDVTREYYINDAGAQVDVLARSAYLRYREALGETIEIPEGLYPGDYLVPVGKKLAHDHGRTLLAQEEAEWLPVVRAATITMMMAAIRDDLAALNIDFDVFFSERSLIVGKSDQVAAAINFLRDAGHIYEGRLPPPKGAPVEDYEDREQTLFRASEFGDDVDRPLKKSDGAYTYFASDIAYHKSKVDRGFLKMIDVWGADHGGYIKRMKAAVAAISAGRADLDVKIVQLVKLLRNGEPVKMSKRSGDFVTLREVVDEVGRDAVRFMMLYRKNDAVLDFDLARVIEQSRDNPVFYVQYGHARCASIFRNAAAEVADLPQGAGEEAAVARAKFLSSASLDLLSDPAELSLMRRIALYPRAVEQAGLAHEPHRIAFYLYELASEFHSLWSLGSKEKPYLRFIIQNDLKITLARLALVQGVVTVLASGLNLLGVGAPEEMR
ncbi:arginine--tRNA ligase [Xanthobacteraceae bacterium Astr-EGSB]|uniref:arginine--tRNA ligase n=1 Tax=Astrobacterium formosum TaxID=3069710 RepID=UPI0027B74214|nr:arginine--tRNA ligase [Xanthobacteraceae bacterium Astr-EGSB]